MLAAGVVSDEFDIDVRREMVEGRRHIDLVVDALTLDEPSQGGGFALEGVPHPRVVGVPVEVGVVLDHAYQDQHADGREGRGIFNWNGGALTVGGGVMEMTDFGVGVDDTAFRSFGQTAAVGTTGTVDVRNTITLGGTANGAEYLLEDGDLKIGGRLVHGGAGGTLNAASGSEITVNVVDGGFVPIELTDATLAAVAR